MGGTGPATAEPRTVHLVRAAEPVAPPPPPSWDEAQAVVVDHRRGTGPMVVLGAPGTGKTSVLVASVLARVTRDGVPPDRVLVLAPTRSAAAVLRDRISAGLARTVREPLARTPHSYAFGLLRRSRVLDGEAPPRLISGPEQDRILADLLAGHEAGVGTPPAWPPDIGQEIRALRGFRDELRDLFMRAVERGLTPEDLVALGRRHQRPDWVAAATVLEEYLDVTALATPGAFDPAAIVDTAAAELAGNEELLLAERARWSLVAVDDAQELTAAAFRLLDLLVTGGRDLLLVGDPDEATQVFRGASPRLLPRAADRFRCLDGASASTVVLSTAHRHGPLLRSVAARVVNRIASPGTLVHRRARPGADTDEGVEVHLLASAAQEAAFVAQYLRRAHLDAGIPWQRMAVVLRSSRGTETLRRALVSAGIPIVVPVAELPVRDEPAVVPLRRALRCCVDPTAVTPEVALDLLCGPIGGADTLAVRRLRQALRAEELAGGGGRPSDVLLVEALADPARLASLDPRTSRPARRVARVLAAGREVADQPTATPETVLWAIWDATGLGEYWRRTALGGGSLGARADRDLDAVVALFEAAARFTDRLPHAGAAAFLDDLEGQDLPADTLADRAPTGRAVSMVTAQGAAGREWDVVAVAGVQEGQWPDLRLRTSLLGAQDLVDLVDDRTGDGAATVSAQRRAVLDDELRFFHVAITRARRRLLVTAVRSDEVFPSVFLDLVDGGPEGAGQDAGERRRCSVVPRTMTLPALVAELRGVVTDPQLPPAVRAEAALQLARLAVAEVPGADPEDWYGLAPPTATGPLRPSGTTVRVSPSRVEVFDRCALRWLLEHCGGTRESTAAQGLGTLIHEIAEAVPDGDRQRMLALLDERFGRLGLGSGWLADAERARAERMIGKLAEYLSRSRAEGRELLATERDVEARIGTAVVRGQVDRLERDPEGRLVVVDLKTSRSSVPRADLPRHAQLGVYQATVEAGGFAELTGPAEPGGALLVQLGTDTKGVTVQRQGAPAEDGDPGWARSLVESVARGMAGEAFPATVNQLCRACDLRRSCPASPEGRRVGE